MAKKDLTRSGNKEMDKYIENDDTFRDDFTETMREDLRERDLSESIPPYDTTGYRALSGTGTDSENKELDKEPTGFWDETLLKNINEVHARLSKGDIKPGTSLILVRDQEEKNKTAQACLDLIEETPLEREEIIEKANILNRFTQYDFTDELNEVFDIANKITLSNKTEEEIFDYWDTLMDKLEDYVSERMEGI